MEGGRDVERDRERGSVKELFIMVMVFTHVACPKS
jgi:hypothetical protein